MLQCKAQVTSRRALGSLWRLLFYLFDAWTKTNKILCSMGYIIECSSGSYIPDSPDSPKVDRVTILMNSRLVYLLGPDHANWSYSEPYLAYITPEIIARSVISVANEHFNGLIDKVIWDMFAGIGTDAIRLARSSGRVICTEINPATYKDLLKNIETTNTENVKPIQGSCIDHLDKIRCNIVYFDPPWGETFQSGVDFDFGQVRLQGSQGQVSVLELAKRIQKKCHLIIKSPFSSDSFEKLFVPEDIICVSSYRQQKLKFIFVKQSDTEVNPTVNNGNPEIQSFIQTS